MIQDRLVVGGQERLIGAFAAPDGREAADAPDELVGAGWRIAGRAGPLAHETSRVDVWAAAEQRPKEPNFHGGCPRNIRLRRVSHLLRPGGAQGLELPLEDGEPRGSGGALGVKPGEAGSFLFDRPPQLIVWRHCSGPRFESFTSGSVTRESDSQATSCRRLRRLST
jgi:hypothetical protein